jgi:hypothetical protein
MVRRPRFKAITCNKTDHRITIKTRNEFIRKSHGCILGARRGDCPPESVFKELIICELHISNFFYCGSFYNEIKLHVSVNTELSFLSGPYIVENQIKHKCNYQNTDRC